MSEEGKRLHPLGLFVHFFAGLPQLVLPGAAAVFGTRGNSAFDATQIVLIVLVVSLLFRWLIWLRFRFIVGDDDIRIESGLLNRNVRAIPFDRIHDVSIEQKALARILGLCEVKFETGGGDGDDAKLSYVSLAEAGLLRDTVRGQQASANAAIVGAYEQAAPIFAMDNRRLVTLGFYSFSLFIFAVLGGLAQQFDFLLPFDVWDVRAWVGAAEDRGVSIERAAPGTEIAALLTALFTLGVVGIASGIIRTFFVDYGFRLDRTAKGFRRRRGLLSHTDVVMPVNRIQAAAIVTGPIRKRRGWHALKFVSLAQESKKERDHLVAPLARIDEIMPILAEARLRVPRAALPFAPAHSGLLVDRWMLIFALVVTVLAVVWLASGIFAWWALFLFLPYLLVDWLAWRCTLSAIDIEQLYARQGWWRQRLDIARQVNVQSVTLSQGPLERRRGAARLDFGIAGGSLAFSGLPLATAETIRDAVLAKVAPVDFSALGLADR